MPAIVAGVWLMFAPAVFDYGDPAATNDRIFGPIAASIAFVAMWPVVRELRWLVLPVALWLLVAPAVLTYEELAAVISTEAVALVLGATTRLGATSEEFGGGWAVLWAPTDPERP